MQAIQTEYSGYHFRSRLEARWAVALDSMGIPWEYEPEGFELNGCRYLPDFYLPQTNAYLEIKGKPASDAEIEKLVAFADALGVTNDATQMMLLMDVNVAWDTLNKFVALSLDNGLSKEGAYEELSTHLKKCPKVFLLEGICNAAYLILGGKAIQLRDLRGALNVNARKIEKGINAGKSARFEFGESGATV